MKTLSNEKGFSMLSAIFTILILGIMGFTLSPLVSTQAIKSVLEYHGRAAFYVADGGLQMILGDQFYGDADFSDNVSPTDPPFGATSITLGDGEFWAQYANQTVHSADVTVTGRVEDGVRSVLVTVSKGPAGGNGIHAGGDCEFLSSQGGGGSLSGDITCGTAPQIGAGYTVTGTTGTGPPPPDADVQALINLTTTTINGNLDINGDYTGNVFVTGRVRINDPGTINGIIVAGGDMEVDVRNTEDRDINGTLAAVGNILVDYRQSSTGSWFAQTAGGIIQPILVSGGDLDLTFHQDTIVDLHGLIHVGGDARIELRQRDAVVLEGAIVVEGSIHIDAKQDTLIDIDSSAGQGFIGGGVLLTQWQEV